MRGKDESHILQNNQNLEIQPKRLRKIGEFYLKFEKKKFVNLKRS